MVGLIDICQTFQHNIHPDYELYLVDELLRGLTCSYTQFVHFVLSLYRGKENVICSDRCYEDVALCYKRTCHVC